jgi:hypothetical protein
VNITDTRASTVGGCPHNVDVGDADFGGRSARIRYPNANGGYNLRSPQVPMGCVEELNQLVADNDELDVKTCAKIIAAYTASIIRQTP